MIHRKISIDELNTLIDQMPEAEEDLTRLESFFHLVEDSESKKLSTQQNVVAEDLAQRNSLEPRIELNLENVDAQNAAISSPLLDKLNKASKKWRQRRYYRKLEIFDRNRRSYIKIVSEGDSWFQFPLFIGDTIDQIFEPRRSFLSNSDNPYAVFSLGEAAAHLKDVLQTEEYLDGLRKIKPEWFLISGGGNDLLDGDKGVAEVIRKFPQENPQRPIEEYIKKDRLLERIQDVMDMYRQVFKSILDAPEFNQVKIICYGYDYVRPKRHGRILGEPFDEQNITNETTMFKIMKVVIDELNEALEKLVMSLSSSDRLFYVDCRGAVSPDEWFDDFHPKSSGYKSVAQRIISKIQQG